MASTIAIIGETAISIDKKKAVDAGFRTSTDMRLTRSDVPVENLTQNLAVFLKQMGSILESIPGTLGQFQIDTMKIDVEVSAEGSIGLLGTGSKLGGKGGLSFELKRVAPQTGDTQ